MNLAELKGQYDVAFSLGHNCLAASQLNHSRIRTMAGVIDWMITPQLSEVCSLLRNRFNHMMQQENMSVVGINSLAGCYIVRDAAYEIYSHHDFPLVDNNPDNLASYTILREKIDRRAERFLNRMNQNHKTLFVRTEANLHETAELLDVLNEITTGEYKLLVVNHAPVQDVVQVEWHLPNVCTLLIPQVDNMFEDNHMIWRKILKDIYATQY
ncbi:papain-like cysteine peptidase [Neobacillus mesonae]|nr:papain-like cysteine peptidase [Neobacillus mesonae]